MRHTRFQGAVLRDTSILLIRHHARRSGNRYWVMPGGGIEAGESEVECVRRELREETGLDVTVDRLVVDARNPRGRFYRRQKTFLCTAIGGTASPGIEPEEEAADYEITDVRWFDLRDPVGWMTHLGRHDWVLPLLIEIRRLLGLDGPDGGEWVQEVRRLDAITNRTARLTTRDGTALRIRQADAGDLERAWGLMTEAREALLNAGIRQWPDAYPNETVVRSDIAAGNLWLAEIDATLAGMVTANDEFHPHYADIPWRGRGTALYMHRLVASPRLWRSGIGSVLVDHVEEIARTFRYGSVRLDAFAENPAALRLYAGRGYRRVGSITARPGVFHCFERGIRAPGRDGRTNG